jgi:hypothetical protein
VVRCALAVATARPFPKTSSPILTTVGANGDTIRFTATRGKDLSRAEYRDIEIDLLDVRQIAFSAGGHAALGALDYVAADTGNCYYNTTASLREYVGPDNDPAENAAIAVALAAVECAYDNARAAVDTLPFLPSFFS